MKYIALIIISVVLFLSSCTYYEHGPTFSIKSPNTRIIGDWQLSDVIINDRTNEIVLNSELDISLVFLEEGNLLVKDNSISRILSSYTGTWEFNDDKTTLILSFEGQNHFSENQQITYNILRLTETELWIVGTYNDKIDNDYVVERRYSKLSID